MEEEAGREVGCIFLNAWEKKKVLFRLANIRGRLRLSDEMKEVGSCINLKSRERPHFFENGKRTVEMA